MLESLKEKGVPRAILDGRWFKPSWTPFEAAVWLAERPQLPFGAFLVVQPRELLARTPAWSKLLLVVKNCHGDVE